MDIIISEELKNIISQLNNSGKMDYFECANEEQILKFEKDNAVCLPTKYKEWLCFSDGGDLFLPAGVQFYGVAHKPIINIKCDDLPSEKYIVIGALCTGDPILCEKENEQISIYNREAGKIEDDEVYTDFFEFLNDLYGLLGIEE